MVWGVFLGRTKSITPSSWPYRTQLMIQLVSYLVSFLDTPSTSNDCDWLQRELVEHKESFRLLHQTYHRCLITWRTNCNLATRVEG